MTTQQAITGFTVPNNLPGTPKQKRATKKSKDPSEAISPSQVSLDHKAIRTAPDQVDCDRSTSSPCADTPLQEVKEDINRKTRGRGSNESQAPRANTPPKA